MRRRGREGRVQAQDLRGRAGHPPQLLALRHRARHPRPAGEPRAMLVPLSEAVTAPPISGLLGFIGGSSAPHDLLYPAFTENSVFLCEGSLLF